MSESIEGCPYRMRRAVPGRDPASQLREVRIELERVADRYTVPAWSPGVLEQLKRRDEVLRVLPVNDDVAKVIVQPGKRDESMKAARAVGLVAHHAYQPAGNDGTMFYLTDEIIVRFKDRTDQIAGHVKRTLRDHGLVRVRNFADGRTVLAQVTEASDGNPLKVADRVERAASGAVEWAEPNLVNRFRPTQLRPRDRLFAAQWHLHAVEHGGGLPDSSIDALGAWEKLQGYGSPEIVVAVIDDGFDLAHPDFDAEGKLVLPGGASGPFGLDPQATWSNRAYHGTPCAGLIAATANRNGEAVGVAPDCRLMPIRIHMAVSDANLEDVFRTVGAQADVISCSWAPPPVDAPASTVMLEALADIARTGGSSSRRGRGTVVCFAAGNDGAPINSETQTECEWHTTDGTLKHTTGKIKNALASSPHVIVVTASTSESKYARYNNYGPEAWVSAPSDDWTPGTASEDIRNGLGIVTTDNEDTAMGYSVGDNYTTHFGGTSAANAIVAGVAALVLSANRNLTAADVRRILADTADPVRDGDGSRPMGRGRVNARNAVERALESDGQSQEKETAVDTDEQREEQAREFKTGILANEARFDQYLDDLMTYLMMGFGAGLGGPREGQPPMSPETVQAFVKRYKEHFGSRLKEDGFEVTSKSRLYLFEAFMSVGQAARGLANERGQNGPIDAETLKEAHGIVAQQGTDLITRFNRRFSDRIRLLGSFCK